jgi:tetratricopeptide (TPR) repeat protein
MSIAKEDTMAYAETLIRTSEAQDLLLRGLLELSRGDDEAALEAFAALLAGSDESSLAALCAAQLLTKRRDFAGAAAILEALAARDPALAEAHKLLGQAYLGMHRTMAAIQSFRRSLALDPADDTARAALDDLTSVQEP